MVKSGLSVFARLILRRLADWTRRFFAPDAGEGGLNLLLEAGDQFAVGGDQRLLGFDLRHDRLLRGEGRERDITME